MQSGIHDNIDLFRPFLCYHFAMQNKPTCITLKHKPGKIIGRGHPWVFSGAIESMHGNPACGDSVDILDDQGEWIGRGLINPQAALRVRIYTRNPDEMIGHALFANRIDRALAWRDELFADSSTNAHRLIFSEADGLSGLIVDRYADRLAVQVSAGALIRHLPFILDHLKDRTGISRVIVRAEDLEVEREGIDRNALHDTGSNPVRIMENGFDFTVDVRSGQKTGFYLDQRVNRQRVAAYARGRHVLSGYCYTGAFEVYAARQGAASVTGIDSSEPALEQAKRHMQQNAPDTPVAYIRADVPSALRRFRDQGRSFDLIILDPPRLIASPAHMAKGRRAYKDINLFAMKLLTPGGILATFSCSGPLNRPDFEQVVQWAARDAARTVQVLEHTGQPPDHPSLVDLPETEYLKGLICRVL